MKKNIFINMDFKISFKKTIVLILFFLVKINISSAQIINIEEKRIKTRDSIRWYGDLSLSASFVQLNKNILTLRGAAQVEYKKNKHLVLSISDYSLLKGGSESFENAAFQHLRYNYKIKDELTYELFTQLQTNKIQHINSRFLLGTGLRYRLFRSENHKNRIYLGVAYMEEYNRFKGDIDKNFHRISSYLSAIYEKGNVKFNSTNYFQPNLGERGNYRLSSQSSLAFKINKHLSFKIDFNVAYDPTLPQTIKPFSYNWTNGVKWIL
jgi:putative salt-induced outer membrane protein YdiY